MYYYWISSKWLLRQIEGLVIFLITLVLNFATDETNFAGINFWTFAVVRNN